MKFKVGDRVKVIKVLLPCEDDFIEEDFLDKEGVISYIYNTSGVTKFPYDVDLENGILMAACDEELELI